MLLFIVPKYFLVLVRPLFRPVNLDRLIGLDRVDLIGSGNIAIVRAGILLSNVYFGKKITTLQIFSPKFNSYNGQSSCDPSSLMLRPHRKHGSALPYDRLC